MGKQQILFSVISMIFSTSNAGRTFECQYVKNGSMITQDELTETQVLQCKSRYGDGCKCSQIATKCTYGPDENGEFIIDQVVPDGTAARCDKATCICSSHDNYHRIVAQRLAEAEEKLTGQGDEESEEAEVNEPDTDIEEEVPQNQVDQGVAKPSSNSVDERDITSWEG